MSRRRPGRNRVVVVRALPDEFSTSALLAEDQPTPTGSKKIRVNPRRSSYRLLYRIENSNPAFGGNNSATFLSRSAIADGASRG